MPDNPPPSLQTPCPEDAQPQAPPRKERRAVPRESTGTPPHIAENTESPEPIAPIAPHMAEKEPVTEAEFVTVNSPKGKTTIIFERVPGKAAHATVVEENTDAPETRRERRKRRRAERKSRML